MVPILEDFEGGDGTVVAGEPSINAANNENGKAEPEKVDSYCPQKVASSPHLCSL